MKFKHITSILLACTLTSVSAFAEQASLESIKELMKKSGADQMGMQMMNKMLPAFKRMTPEAPEEFWTAMMKEISMDDMIDKIVPIYQKHLTQQDVSEITAFFESNAEKKLISKQPQIMQESMIAGQQWGEETAVRVMEKYNIEFPAK